MLIGVFYLTLVESCVVTASTAKSLNRYPLYLVPARSVAGPSSCQRSYGLFVWREEEEEKRSKGIGS